MNARLTPVPRIAVTRTLPEPGATSLQHAGFVVDQLGSTGNPGVVELAAAFATASGALTTLADVVDRTLLEQSPHLKVVANIAVGFDNIDLVAARELGIVVTNTPDVLTEAVADLAWALLLAAARRIVEGDSWARSGAWPGWAPDQVLGQTVHGKTIAIVGMGRIGAAIGRRARGFGMQVLSCSRTPKPLLEDPIGARRLPLHDALAEADFVVVVAPLTSSSHHLIDAEAFAAMRPNAVLVNVGRGSVVDERALIDAVRGGVIAGAGLDVFEFEPEISAELRSLPNVVLTPHIGSATHETRAKMVQLCCDNIIRVIGGDSPLTPVG